MAMVLGSLCPIACRERVENSFEREQEAEYHFSQGAALQAAGRQEEAISEFTKAIALMPDRPEFFIQRGQAKLNAGQLAEAMADADKAGTLDRTGPHALALKGLVYVRMGQPKKAITSFTDAIQLATSAGHTDCLGRIYMSRGSALADQGDFDEAMADVDAAIKYDPLGEHALVGKAMVLAAWGRPAEAREAFATAARLRPDSESVLYNAFSFFFQQDDLAAALTAVDKLLALEQDDDHTGTNYALRSQVHLFSRPPRLDEALVDVTAAIKLGPQRSRGYAARAHILLAKQLLSASAADAPERSEIGAVERRICESLPKQLLPPPSDYSKKPTRPIPPGKIRFWRGIREALEPRLVACLESPVNIDRISRRLHERTVADLERAIELDPARSSPYLDKAIAHIVWLEFHDAIEAISLLIEKGSTPSRYYMIRAMLCRLDADYDGVIGDCTKAIEHGNEDALPYLLRGEAYLLQRQYDQAIGDFDATLKIDPDYSEALELREQAVRAKADGE
jgi:tetratricopeptide (TPR) repeat protein